ncbi:MAG: hypothetical protein ABI651_07220 [Verrucomicrobiota bacterium]
MRQISIGPGRLSLASRLRVVQGNQTWQQANLDEAQQTVERDPIRLHLAGIQLHRTRLFRDKEEAKRARDLIAQCGNWPRKQELKEELVGTSRCDVPARVQRAERMAEVCFGMAPLNAARPAQRADTTCTTELDPPANVDDTLGRFPRHSNFL